MAENSRLMYKTCQEIAGLTQEKAATYLNIDVTTLARYENGRLKVD